MLPGSLGVLTGTHHRALHLPSRTTRVQQHHGMVHAMSLFSSTPAGAIPASFTSKQRDEPAPAPPGRERRQQRQRQRPPKAEHVRRQTKGRPRRPRRPRWPRRQPGWIQTTTLAVSTHSPVPALPCRPPGHKDAWLPAKPPTRRANTSTQYPNAHPWCRFAVVVVSTVFTTAAGCRQPVARGCAVERAHAARPCASRSTA